MQKCQICNGTKFVVLEACGRVPCPVCAAQGYEDYVQPDNTKSADELLKSESADILTRYACRNSLAEDTKKNIMRSLRIPQQYQDCAVMGGLDVISAIEQKYKQVIGVPALVEAMYSISDSIKQKTLHYNSLYLCVGSKQGAEVKNDCDLLRFAYGVILEAVKNDIGVVPLISLRELTYLATSTIPENNENEENIVRHQFTGGISGRSHSLNSRIRTVVGELDYLDYITAPLVFLHANPLATNVQWEALADLLLERSMRSLPTYVVGYWHDKKSISLEEVKLGVSPFCPFIENTDRNTVRLDKLLTFSIAHDNNLSRGVRPEYFSMGKLQLNCTLDMATNRYGLHFYDSAIALEENNTNDLI